jgi:DNA-binding NarL/FixJ family response regulator
MDTASERAAAMRFAAKGDISSAIGILRPLAEASDDPGDRLLLGRMAYLATDYTEAQTQLENAYREFQGRSQPRRAAIAATALGFLYFDGLEDQVVGRGWFARALRLLEHEGPCVERGYVVLGLMGASVASARELEANARIALELAHRFQDRNLECKALGDSGLALVSMGRIRDGIARLDEAFTMIISGDCTDPSVISQVVCDLLSGCDRCGDVARAETWLRFIEKRASRHTLATCWSAFGSVLCQVGRWKEGETHLRMGLARGQTSVHHIRLATRALLADLWIRQGRLDEAGRLIDQSVDRVEISGPRARLYLAQGRYDLAAAVARQALRQLTGDCLRAASMLLVLVEAELGGGNAEAAEEAAKQLQQLSEATEFPPVAAKAALALGKTAAARGDLKAAAYHFDAGLAELAGDTWPLLRAPLHLDLAGALLSKAPAEAIVNAQAALSIYQRIGAPEASLAADLLQAQGVRVTVAPPPPTALDVLSRREREVLALLAQGMSNSAIAKRLFITAKTSEHHVSSILGKLGLRNRTEAAAFAASFQISREEGYPQRDKGKMRG